MTRFLVFGPGHAMATFQRLADARLTWEMMYDAQLVMATAVAGGVLRLELLEGAIWPAMGEKAP